ncbi:hypothetical protein K7862_03760 [Streptomyces sp. PLK6-54]|uniref:Flp pilus assembly protein RcpC/CpaB domain-containing protein n=1 Tax=Actinacidiphila acidipaludis TaxID=2873382 RepID=A0ABS7Q0V0_9ACTN|nr:hypothetical protein [Streptomyces acidipaludis]
MAPLTTPPPYAPPRWDVPDFPPIRLGGRGGKRLLRRAVRRRRRPIAVGLSVAAAVLVVSAANGAPPRPVAAASRGPAVPATTSAAPHREVYVRAPVRIADAAAARLLHPGDRVDVLAGGRVVAVSARVISVLADQDESSGLVMAREGIGTGAGGALLVLSVPRKTAAALSGAAATSPLAVALC